MNLKTIEELDILYYKVFYGHSEKEEFTYAGIKYLIKNEYSKRYPKVFYGNGINESYRLTDMKKLIKGEEIKPNILPKPHPYMYR